MYKDYPSSDSSFRDDAFTRAIEHMDMFDFISLTIAVSKPENQRTDEEQLIVDAWPVYQEQFAAPKS